MNTCSIWKVNSDEEENQEGIDGVITLLATINIRAGRVDNFDPGGDLPDMIIETIFGLILSVASTGEATNTGQKVLSALNTTAKIIEKTEKKEWKASMHEEGYQITKDSILKMGGLK